MDIALIIGVVLGMVFMVGSIAYALFVEGAAGGFGNFVSIPFLQFQKMYPNTGYRQYQ